MSNTIAAKLTAVEAALKENVSKVVKSKVSGNFQIIMVSRAAFPKLGVENGIAR